MIVTALAMLAFSFPVRGEEAPASSAAESATQAQPGRPEVATVAPAGVPGLPAEPMAPYMVVPPSAAIPKSPDGRLLRWIIRPWIGVTTVRLGTLDDFPAKSARIRERRVFQTPVFSASITGETSHGIDYGIISGLSVGYQFHPLFSAGLQAGYLKTEQGSYTAKARGTADIADSWTTRMDSILALAGMSLKMPFSETTRMYSSLYVGASFTTVYVYHQYWITYGGSTSMTEAQATAFGRGFVPEFMLHLEHDLAPTLAVGCDLGYRFGGVSALTHRHTTNVNYMTQTGAEKAGTIMRDAEGTILAVDHGGLVFALALSARL